MNQQSRAPLRLDDLVAYPDPDEADAYLVVPGAPVPERGPQGRPTLTLWVRGDGGLLQLGSRWEVTEARLAELEALLERQTGGAVRLRPAPLEVGAAELELVADDGTVTCLARSGSAGFPPYTALFNTPLSAAQQARAAQGLGGTAGCLAVTYRGRLTARVPVTATLAGDARRVLADLPPDAAPGAVRALIDDALAAGRLTVVVDAPGDASAALREQVADEACELATRLLAARTAGAPHGPTIDAAAFSVTVARTTTEPIPFQRSADVASWFPAGEGTRHIQVLA